MHRIREIIKGEKTYSNPSLREEVREMLDTAKPTTVEKLQVGKPTKHATAIAAALAGIKTATALQTMTFAALKFIVPGLIVEGCVLLVGKPKAMSGSIAERYLREKRGIGCPLPATLGFLPARGDYAPALIAAFGLTHEVEPGIIATADNVIRGVHLTRLLPDGSDRERGDHAKIMVGMSAGLSGWSLDAPAKAEIDRILRATIPAPIGPEFMAPPARSVAA